MDIGKRKFRMSGRQFFKHMALDELESGACVNCSGELIFDFQLISRA